MIEEDWGALEGSEWGSAPLAEAVTVKPVPHVKKDTPQKTKAVKNKQKKLKVLDSGNSQEKSVEKTAVLQPKKKVFTVYYHSVLSTNVYRKARTNTKQMMVGSWESWNLKK